MIDHDRLFKELLTTFFWEFIELFLPEVALYLDRDSITFLDKEIFSDVTIGDRYEADIVARCQFRGQESYFLVHLEHQAQGQVHFPQRMFRYFSLLYAKYNLPVYPIALFSSTYPLKADIVAMNPETQEAVMEIVTSWMEEGIQQGIQQGMQAIVQRQLLKRIGTIQPELQARISQLSSIQLEDLAEAVLDFSSAADLVAWLQGISG
jgi:hypothetical protein